MKIIKYLLLSLTLSLCCPQTTDAQVLSTLMKTAGKQSIKHSFKQTVKNVAVAKVKKKVKKEVLESTLEKSASRSAKTLVEDNVRHTALRTMQKRELAATGKTVTRHLSRKAIRELEEKALEQQGKRVMRTEMKGLLTQANKRMALPLLKEVGQESTQQIALHQTKHELLSKALNGRAAAEWRKIAGTSLAKDNLLLRDLSQHPQLRTYLAKNPAALENYHNLIGSKYRTDITLLRYTNYHADKARDIVVHRTSKKWSDIKGNQILLSDEQGKTLIKDRATQQVLGTLEGDARKGYTIHVAAYEGNNPLTEIMPLKNSTLVVGSNSYHIDPYGRVSKVVATIDKNLEKGVRIPDHYQAIQTYKTEYTTMNVPVSAHKPYDDIGGHLVPDSWGGQSSMCNIVPQNNKVNGSGIWIKSENEGKKMAKKGHTVTREIQLSYSDVATQRPSGFYVTQTVDGKIQEVKGHRMDHLFIDNPIVVKEK